MSGVFGGDRAVNVTDGALVKPLVVLSLPIVLTNLLMVGYNLADTFWVGRLGQAAVAALSFSWAIIFLIISLALGFSVAGTVLVAQNKGAGNIDHVSHVAGQTITVVLGASVLISIVGVALSPRLLQLVGAVPGTEAYRLAVLYTRTEFVGMTLIFGFFIFQSLLQGWGDTQTPFYLMTFGVGLNVIIDPFFILGFEGNVIFAWFGLEWLEAALYDATGFVGWGVQGAAIATILSRAAGAAVGMWLLLSGQVGIRLSIPDFRPDPGTIRQIVTIGAPSSVEISTKALSITILTALVAIGGAQAVAAYGIGNRITSMVVLPALGLARGVETVVGQNLGANQADRAKRGVLVAVAIIAGCLFVFSVFVYMFADLIVGIFITGQGAATVTGLGAEYLRIVSLSYVLFGSFYVIQGGFRGSGSTRTAMFFAFVGFIVFSAAFAYVLAIPVGLGATGVWYGEALAYVLVAALAGLHFLRGTWADVVIEDAGPGATSRRVSGEKTTSGDESTTTNGGAEKR